MKGLDTKYLRGLSASILYKSIAGRYRPVSYPDGPITTRYRFIKNAYWASTSCVNHHSETHIIKNTVMKQSKGLNGDLKPEYKKTTDMTMTSPTIGIDSGAPTIWNRLGREPSFSLRIGHRRAIREGSKVFLCGTLWLLAACFFFFFFFFFFVLFFFFLFCFFFFVFFFFCFFLFFFSGFVLFLSCCV